jgi:predicted acylesterase/phospholipase RssA
MTQNHQTPARECDVVMKGGITSGIVYPLAIAELATGFRLRNIGGTSAGAIAAAAAAAAEVGRRSGGFERLATLPARLGERAGKTTLLQRLFQPQPTTKATFDTLTAPVFTGGSRSAKGRAAFRTALVRHPLPALIGLIPGVVLAVFAWGAGSWPPRFAGIVGGVLLAIVGCVAAVAVQAVRRFLRSVPENGYGLCLGSTEQPTPGLTEFLAEEFDSLAGVGKGPLTIGDLEAAGVSLRMLGTNITQGAPLTLPEDLSGYWYEPDELRRYFPAPIVEHLINHEPEPENEGDRIKREERRPFRRMPAPSDIPVIVPVRMSLSFPILLSAVPLLAVDYREEEPERELRVNWISDGGITSNFPIHFFDRPLPSRPTFAVSLAPTNRTGGTPEDHVFIPESNISGILRRWTSFEGVPGFLGAVADTMQNWADTEQSRIPGYRDRIATIFHTGAEGGLNLDMPSEVIEAMSARGRVAGRRLRDDFDFVNHRWIRYRSVMALLEEWLQAYSNGFHTSTTDVPSYIEMIAGPPPTSYRSDWSRAKSEFADLRTQGVVDLARRWPDVPGGHEFAEGAPSPRPTLRVTPHH